MEKSFFLVVFLYYYISTVNSDLTRLSNIAGKPGYEQAWSDRYPQQYCLYSWKFKGWYYETCSPPIGSNITQNCTVESKEYLVENITRLMLKIRTSTTKCSIQEHPECQENISLYYALKYDLKEKDRFLFFEKFPKILTPLILNKTTHWNNFYINTDNCKYIKFALNTRYFCGNVTAFRLYDYHCPIATEELVVFNKSNIPKSGEIKVMGRCTDYASANISNSFLFQTCKSDGTSVVSAKCKCNPGFTKNDKKCVECQSGEFKNTFGNHACAKCGYNSISTGSTSCPCKEGHYRAHTQVDDFSRPCYKLPFKITGSITARPINSSFSFMNISWNNRLQGPSFKGYMVECYSCSRLNQRIFTENRFLILKDLYPATMYNVSVSIWDDITNATKKTNKKFVIFTTLNETKESVGGQIMVNLISSSQVKVSWTYSEQVDNINGYLFECNSCPKAYTNIQTKEKFVLIKELLPFTEYTVYVSMTTNETKTLNTIRGKIDTTGGVLPPIRNIKKENQDNGSVVLSWQLPNIPLEKKVTIFILEYGNRTVKTSKKFFIFKEEEITRPFDVKIMMTVEYNEEWYEGIVTVVEIASTIATTESSSQKTATEDKVSMKVFLGVVAGVIIFFVLVLFLLIYCGKRKGRKHMHMSMSYKHLDEPKVMSQRHEYVPLPERKDAIKDPFAYHDIQKIVEELITEIPRKNLETTEEIAVSGSATIFKGTFHQNEKIINVSITKLKPKLEKETRDSYMGGAAILSQMKHPNIVTMFGAVAMDAPEMFVTEYMEKGSLDKYLQRNNNLTVIQRVRIAHNIVAGLTYLEKRHYVYKTLCAKNILVDGKGVCKIFNFHSNQENDLETTYQNRESFASSLRWLAPELLENGEHTIESLVWSYGIVLWEIMSFGEQPYWHFTNDEVTEKLKTGYRLPPPSDCPNVIYNMMLECWNVEPSKRPSFEVMKDNLEFYYMNPDVLKDLASVETMMYESLYYNGPPDIKTWLKNIDLQMYADQFLAKKLETVDQVMKLSENDLMEIGIIPIAHRRKIYQSIQNLKNQK